MSFEKDQLVEVPFLGRYERAFVHGIDAEGVLVGISYGGDQILMLYAPEAVRTLPPVQYVAIQLPEPQREEKLPDAQAFVYEGGVFVPEVSILMLYADPVPQVYVHENGVEEVE